MMESGAQLRSLTATRGRPPDVGATTRAGHPPIPTTDVIDGCATIYAIQQIGAPKKALLEGVRFWMGQTRGGRGGGNDGDPSTPRADQEYAGAVRQR